MDKMERGRKNFSSYKGYKGFQKFEKRNAGRTFRPIFETKSHPIVAFAPQVGLEPTTMD